MAQGCAESPAGSGADPTAAVAGTIFLYLRSGRGKESRFGYLRIMTPIIAEHKSGKPLFCAVWMRPYEDEIRSVEGQVQAGTAPKQPPPRTALHTRPSTGSFGPTRRR